MEHPVARTLTRLLCVLALAPPVAHARTVEPAADGWILERWTREDGLPIDHIRDMAVDPAGLLWLATFDGLVRFDGLGFETFRTSHPEGPPSNRLITLAVNPGDGALWVRTDDFVLQRRSAAGLQTFAQEHFDWFTPGDRTLWVSGVRGVYRLEETPRLALPLDGVTRIGADPTGELWLVREGGEVDRWNGDTLTREVVDPPLPWEPILLRDGAGWPLVVAHPDGPTLQWEPATGRTTRLPHPPPSLAAVNPARPSHVLLQDDHTVLLDGRPLITTVARVWRILQDGGAIWLATEGEGLARLRPAGLRTHAAGGAGDGNVVRVWWDARDEVLWGLSVGGGWESVDPAGVPASLPADLSERVEIRFSLQMRDAEGRRWFAHGTRVWREDGDGWTELGPEGADDPLSGLWQAPDGRVWASDPEHVWWTDGEGWHLLAGEGDARPRWIRAWEALPDGRFLMVGLDGLWLVQGTEPLRLDRRSGLGPIRHARLAGDRLWLSTERDGLCATRLAGTTLSVLRCLDERSGLGRSTIHASFVDAAGRTWMSSNQGVGVVGPGQIEAFLQRRIDDVAVLWMDERDGMVNAECNNFAGGGAVADDAGRLWFATQDGVVELDPDAFVLPDPPAVELVEVTVGAEPRSREALELPPGHAPVRIRWTTAPSRWAEQISFRYRLAPADDWSVPSSSRTLELTALPAGGHRLEIQARLGGAWGPTTALLIDRAPALHERSSFGLLLTLALAGLVLLFLGVRSRWLQRLNRQLEEQVADQTRQLSHQNERLSDQNEQLAEQAQALANRNQQLGVQAEALRAQSRQLAAQTEALEEVDRLKRQLIANVSHELRTPLSLIIAPLTTLESGPLPPAAARDVSLARRNAERLKVLIGQLFDLSRAQAGGLALRARVVDAVAVLQTLTERFEPVARERRQRLVLRTPLERLPLWCDPDLLDKVLVNLVSNGLRHGPEGSTVRLTLEVYEDRASFAVEDEGTGVPLEHRERVFERFYQVDSGTSRRFDGAGIGLALVRELVALHGGDVGVGDAAVGARFWFWLPLGAAHLSPDDIADEVPPLVPGPAAPAPPDEEDERARVLLVEDHPEMRAYLAESLGQRFGVVAAEDGAVGLERARERRFDLVISDVMMPRMDGCTFVRHLRELPGYDAVPVMFLSARQELSDRLEGLELADDYLTKPFQVPELLARAAALLRRGTLAPAETEAEDPVTAAFVSHLEAVADAHLGVPSFNVAELARRLAMSVRTLQLRMQDHGLPPPNEWLREHRLTVAGTLLRSGRYATVQDVAAAVGMSPSYFSRAYRAQTGDAPKDHHRPPPV